MASEQIHVLSGQPAAAEATGSTVESARIETLRGIAIIVVVAYHVVGDDGSRGMMVADGSLYRAFCNIVTLLHMPLFTFLAGFVYAYKPVQGGNAWTFTRKKLLRLALPLIVVSTLYFVIQALTPGTNTKLPWGDIWRIYVFPYNHFWYLQAIMLLFAATVALERFRLLRDVPRFLGVMACALAVQLLVDIQPNVFSIRQAIYLLPFFLAGVGANRFHALFWKPRVKLAMLAVFSATFTFHVLGCLHVLGAPLQEKTPLATILSLGAVFTLMYWTRPGRLLTWVGSFSFTIYLYHVFFTAGTRITLTRLGVSDAEANFLLGCLLGIAGPVLVELSMRGSKPARRLLLGQS